MATTRATAPADPAAPGDEFLQLLYRGGELLAAGNVVEAKDQLEKAFSLQPENEKGKNLLGLTYFKLGLYDRAAQLYEMLVQENPADPTLRVNLGLVYLKTNALPRAIHEFATATDLAPDHTKAHNYLGLALAQTGQYAKAREHFLLAGSQAMAEKMALALAEGAGPPLAADGMALEASSLPPESPDPSGGAESAWMAEEQPMAPSESFPAAEAQSPSDYVEQPSPDWNEQLGSNGSGASETASPAEEELRFSDDEGPTLPQYEASSWQRDAEPPSPVPPIAPTEWVSARPPAPEAPGPRLTDWVPSLQVQPEGATAPFDIRPDLVVITVQSELLTRLSGLVSYSGTIDFKPERKRFRGRVTDRGFGEGSSQMTRAKGHGTLLLDPRKQMFISTHLGGEPAYFREDVVFAIEEPVLFENGRLPSDVAPDLDLVYVRGQGQVLLVVPSAPRSIEITGGRPVTVPLENLVGWHGNLTPRISIVAYDDSGKMIRAGVELSGAGFVLFTHPMS